VEALSVSATDLATGRTVVWVERAGGGVPPWSRDPKVLARPARIGPLHALASAAIPVLFPAVEVDGRFYVDGGLKQNTPLSPALRLGADRVMLIRLRPSLPSPESLDQALRPFAFVSRMLDSIFDDHLDYDLDRLRRFNALLDGVAEALGERGRLKLEDLSARGRGQAYRRVREILLHPSIDLASIAADYVSTARFAREAGGLAARTLRRLGERHGELVSYMLFDGGYASQLIELGHEDTRRREDEIVRFLLDETPAAAVAHAV
jgi:NTE family protein